MRRTTAYRTTYLAKPQGVDKLQEARSGKPVARLRRTLVRAGKAILSLSVFEVLDSVLQHSGSQGGLSAFETRLNLVTPPLADP